VGRNVDDSTVGTANAASISKAGWIEANNASVTASLRIHPQVVNSDMYMWSSTNT
jgi:hypothetical protein